MAIMPSPAVYSNNGVTLKTFHAPVSEQIRELPYAARFVARRYGVPPASAVAVATAAGFRMEAAHG